MNAAFFKSRALAEAAIAKIDTHLGYPRMEQGEIGPPVMTTSYVAPIEMDDGRWCVPMGEDIRAAIKAAKLVELDVAKVKRRDEE